MIELRPTNSATAKLDLLLLGAHCDDIEIGCGGTVLKWIAEERVEQVVWVVFSSNERRYLEAKQSAEAYLRPIEKQQIIILDHRDAYLSFAAKQIKDKFEEIKHLIDPDIVMTHYRMDRHQDHRLLSDLAWNTFRNHLILEYEIPKYDGDLGIPNGYVSIPDEIAARKVALLLECYQSQRTKHWFDDETFRSLMRIRGLECNSSSRYAEAFHLRKCMI